jgi:hypothetical protein
LLTGFTQTTGHTVFGLFAVVTILRKDNHLFYCEDVICLSSEWLFEHFFFFSSDKSVCLHYVVITEQKECDLELNVNHVEYINQM